MTAGTEVATLGKHPRAIRWVTYAPDGRSIASGDFGSGLKIWDVEGRRERLGLPPRYAGYVACLAYSPDGRTLAAAGQENFIRLYEPATAKEQANLDVGTTVWTVGFAADGERLAAGTESGALQLWALGARTKAHPRDPKHELDGGRFHTGRQVAGRHRARWHPLTLEPGHGGANKTWQLVPQVWRGTLAPDGRHIAVTNGNGTVSRCPPVPDAKLVNSWETR